MVESTQFEGRSADADCARRFRTFGQCARDPLFRLLAVNWAIGAFVATLVTAGLLVLDIAGLGSLVAASQDPILPVVLLFCGLLITFTSVAMGTAVMLLPSGGGRGKPIRRRRVPSADAALVPIPVPVRSRH